jgi:hypothetical protein
MMRAGLISERSPSRAERIGRRQKARDDMEDAEQVMLIVRGLSGVHSAHYRQARRTYECAKRLFVFVTEGDGR